MPLINDLQTGRVSRPVCYVLALFAFSVGFASIQVDDNPVVASTRDLTLRQDDLQTWHDFRTPSTDLEDVGVRQSLLEEMVLLEVLGQRFNDEDLADDAESVLRLRHLSWQIAAQRLRQKALKDSTPTDDEIRSDFEDDRLRYLKPKQWRLENITKQVPKEATTKERVLLKEEMHSIREQALNDASFNELARQLSDSATRHRGGRMGLVPLDALAPPLAMAVSGMGPGDITQVLEVQEGLVLLRCESVQEAREQKFEDVNEQISHRLRGEKFDVIWSALDDLLLQAAKPKDVIIEASPEMSESTMIAKTAGIDGRTGITLADFNTYLRRFAQGRTAQDLSRDEFRRQLNSRILLEARSLEAEKRGLLDSPEIKVKLHWKSRQLKARIALDNWVNSKMSEPEEEVLHGLYSQRADKLIAPERIQLRILSLKIDRGYPKELYRNTRDLGERAASGSIGFEEVVNELEKFARVKETGWLTAGQAWMLGRNATRALIGLEKGQTTPAVQEGRTLLILHVLDREPERKMQFPEARGVLRAQHLAYQRKELEQLMRTRVLTEQNLVIAP
ncbi:MAG: hypothetical protein GY906_14440 [bacterium]|nr:hypothetical protein [bacterium]